MYHILLISENRILLKNIYQMIEDPIRFRIDVVPFSMDAYESFYAHHADIVILDSEVFLPYESILEQLEQCKWPFQLILLAKEVSETNTLTFTNRRLWLSKNTLSKELFNEIFDLAASSQLTIKLKEIKFSLIWDKEFHMHFLPDVYHFLLIQNANEWNQFPVEKQNLLLLNSDKYCPLHFIGYNKSTALVYIKRSSITSDFHFLALSDIIFFTLGSNTRILYIQQINWKNIQVELNLLLKNQHYLYFLQEESVLLPELHTDTLHPSLSDLKEQCRFFLKDLLLQDFSEAAHILKDIYIHSIKGSRQFYVREYIRLQLNFISKLLYQTTFNFPDTSVEEELDFLLSSTFFKPFFFPSKRIQEILTDALMTIYEQFKTPISLDGIALYLSLNKIYLNKLFKNQFHNTVLEILQTLRVEHAKYYLRFTERKISDIALDSGFSDAGYFSKVFKKMTGFSALDFRKQKDDSKELMTEYECIMEI